jgi:hypothetical protein
MRWFFAALAALSGVLFMAACGDGEPQQDDSPGVYSVVVATGDLAVGPQRLSFVLLKGDDPVSEPVVYVRFFKIPASGSPELVGESPLPWSDLGAEEEPHGDSSHGETELRGVYFANLPFDEAGTWGIGVSPGPVYDEKSEARVQFDVRSKTQTLAVGEKALAATNGTSRDTPLKQIHTGSVKDDGFHDLSIDEALASGRPSVLVFATPSFCQTRTCGPSLQVAVKAAPNYSGKVNFLHIEPYELDADGNLVTRPDGFGKLAKTAETWRLPSEPWVFVLDKSGMVVSRFEGPYALEELTYILDQVSK